MYNECIELYSNTIRESINKTTSFYTSNELMALHEDIKNQTIMQVCNSKQMFKKIVQFQNLIKNSLTREQNLEVINFGPNLKKKLKVALTKSCTHLKL